MLIYKISKGQTSNHSMFKEFYIKYRNEKQHIANKIK